MADTRWLEQRWRGWYAVKDVPRSLRAVIGKKRLLKSLDTRDLHVAIARRHAALAEFQREIDEATRGDQHDPRIDEARAIKATLDAINRGDPATIGQFRGEIAEFDERTGQERLLSPQEQAREIVQSALHDRLETLWQSGKTAEANLLGGIVQGTAEPLRLYVGAWISEGGSRGPVTVRTARQYRSDLAEFEAWLRKDGHAPTIQAVTKAVAGRYVTAIMRDGMNRKTANRKISAVSSYWRWLTKRTAIETNPWTEQSLSKATKPGTPKAKRPYTDDELKALLGGKTDAEMADLIRVAALSGMRIEEVYRLSVADCAGGWFSVKRAKTTAGIRDVPIHSALAAIIARRTQGKPNGAFLFHEAGPAPKPGRERSMPVSKRFGRYRRSCGVTDKLEGARQDRIDFHSLRRWFITKARQGTDVRTVQDIVGHEPGNITDSLYSGGPTDDAKRACVEAVRLPD